MYFSAKDKTFKAMVSAVMLIMTMALICSCSIASKKALIQYAKTNFGACEFIKEEHKGSGNDEYRTVYLKDKETGIEYRVTTKLDSINIDGSIFGYAEGKYSDFTKLYTDYVLDEADSEISSLESKYGMKIDYPKITFYDRVSGSTAKNACKDLSEIISKYDTKDLLDKVHLVYAERTVYVGVYDAAKHVWNPSNEYEVIDYVHSHYDPNAVFCDSIGAYLDQFLSYEEIDRLLPDRDGNTSGTAYYFRDQNGSLFVAIDLRDWGIQNGGIRLFRDTSHGMEEIV